LPNSLGAKLSVLQTRQKSSMSCFLFSSLARKVFQSVSERIATQFQRHLCQTVWYGSQKVGYYL
jgi:hypothetical protein